MLLLLYGIETPDADTPPPEPEPVVVETRSGGAQVGGLRKRRGIIARTVEYRDAEDELVLTWLL